MAHLASPMWCGPGQQLLLLLALLSLDSFLSSPPGHGYHLRPALFAYQQQAFPFKPPHTHWHATGPIEHAFAAAGQPAHPTGTHNSQSFQVLALRLLQHTAVPDAQRRLSSALQLLAPLLRLLPQHLFDDHGFPSPMVKCSLQALRAGFGVPWPRDRASQLARRQLRARLHDPGHHRRQISHHPSIQIGIQPLAIGRQIVFEFTCPRLTLFLLGFFLYSSYVLLREHEEDLLCLTEAFVCLPQCTSGGRLLSASWLFRPFVPKVCSGS